MKANGTRDISCTLSWMWSAIFYCSFSHCVTLPYLDIGLLTSQEDPCATCVATAYWEVQTQTAH